MTTARASHPAEAALALYGSPLRRPVVGWIAGAALIALAGYALWLQSGLVSNPTPQLLGVLAASLLITGALTIVPVLILRWFDRREPEPWFMYALALLWGGLIATAFAIEANDALDRVVGTLLGSVIGAPIVEEAAKGLGLIVLLLVLRSEFDGPRDGFIYGALIGLGFTWLETGIYICNDFVASGTVAWAFQLSSRYALFGLSGHALYTAITGTFIGFALLKPGLPRRIFLPLAGLVLAIVSHFVWNLVGALVFAALIAALANMLYEPGVAAAMVQQPASVPLWVAWPAGIVSALLGNVLGFSIVLIGLRRSDHWERGVMVEQLRPEQEPGVVTLAEYANIERHAEPPREPTARRIFAAQCNLAKRKFYLLQHGRSLVGDPIVDAWRDEARRLRFTA